MGFSIDYTVPAKEEYFKHARILIVDDAVHITNLLSFHLKQDGYSNVAITNDPSNACEIYMREKSDLIILDYNMPIMNGFEVIAALHDVSDESLPPILMLTGESSADFCANTFRAGANDYVVKPFERTELLARVRNLLDMHLAKKALHEKYIEVASQSAKLKEANIKLDKLNKVKSEFVSVVSHELRTPLTSILSSAQVLRDEPDLDLEEKEDFLTIVIDESARLSRLINDILDLQKIDAGHMSWRKIPVDLTKVVSTTVGVFSQAFANKGLYLQSKIETSGIVVLGDADRLQQVISNFLSNALKFTEQGGVIVRLAEPKSWITVLLVANEISMVQHVSSKLDELNICVQRAENCQLAWDLIQSGRYAVDLVLIAQSEYELHGKSLLRDLMNFRKDINFAVIGDEHTDSSIDLMRYNQAKYEETDVESEIAPWMLVGDLDRLVEEATDLSAYVPVVSVSIEDTGAGMPANELARIFQRFYQVERSDTNMVAGTGLGLAISREIVSKFGGKVHVTSEIGKGSSFTFILPKYCE